MSSIHSEVDSCVLLLCLSVQGSHQPDNAGSHAGVTIWRSSQLDDPSEFGFHSTLLLCFYKFILCASSAGVRNNISAMEALHMLLEKLLIVFSFNFL